MTTSNRNRRRKQNDGPRPVRRPKVLVLEGLSGAADIVRAAGGKAKTVSPRNIGGVAAALDAGFDALLLTGGGDVDPRLYGQKPHRRVYGVNETRDKTELWALDRAKELGVPVLGICRGSQMMAVHNGGRLRQHVNGHRNTSHIVIANPGSQFRRRIAAAMGCVSLHHQVVARHGRGFRVAARNKEGMIEAIESKNGRCLGVQFHPEMDYWTNPGSQAIFRWLIEEAADRAGIRAPQQQTERPPVQQRMPDAWLPKPKAPGKNRPAGTRRHPVTTSWLCPHCAIRFDRHQDREDHMWYVHDRPALYDRVGAPTFNDLGLEPPPGSPDWKEGK